MSESDSKKDEPTEPQDDESQDDAPIDEASHDDEPVESHEDDAAVDEQPPAAEPRADGATRRRFLDTAIVGGGAVVGLAAVYPALRFLEPMPGAAAGSTIVAQAADFPPGSSKSAVLGETPVLVIRDDDGAFRAYEAICPHLQCVVRFAGQRGEIVCACHGGRFALSGSPIAGPPKQPLKVLRVNVIGDDVVVSKA